jgi:glycosyltransferase involved in cell wall biosynthesis
VKTVLIVTHDWPPVETAGTERIRKFVQYLPEFGYRPLVLTTGRYGTLANDATAGVFRASDLIHSLFRPLRWRKARGVAPEAQIRVATLSGQSLPGRLRDQLMAPDTKLGWLLPAVHRGREVIATQQPALLFSSSPPETTHLIALRLHSAKGLPWVADLRDGWLFEPPNPPLRQAVWRRAWEGRLERQVVSQATAVVTVTAPIATDLAARYPAAGSKINVISNGFDGADFAALSRQRPADGHFLLVYTGALAASRQGGSADALFDGVAELVRRQPGSPLRLQIVGNFSETEKQAVQGRGLGDVVEFVPPVPRPEAYQRQVDADALLLVTAPGVRSVATSKLFDYIGAGRPILALAQDNAAAGIVQQDDLGITVAPDDPAAIAAALEKLMQQCQTGKAWPGFETARKRYDRRELTRRLAQVFDSAIF